MSGVAKTAEDACCYTSCTLLSTCLDNKELPSSPAQCAKQKVNEVRATCVLNKYGKVVECEGLILVLMYHILMQITRGLYVKLVPNIPTVGYSHVQVM